MKFGKSCCNTCLYVASRITIYTARTSLSVSVYNPLPASYCRRMRYEDFINTYCGKENTDYAVLINGAWGTGKTYQIKKLVEKVKKDNAHDKGLHAILLSLSILKRPNDIIANVLTGFAGNKTKDAIDKVISTITSFAGKNVKQVVATASDTVKSVVDTYIVNKTIENLRNAKCTLFLDDLERYEGEGGIEKLLPFAHETFVENGINVVYIANEEEIKDINSYFKVKEKYIRFTCAFDGTTCETIREIGNETHTETGRTIVSQNAQIISDWMATTGINNLRTFILSIECYETSFLNHSTYLDEEKAVHLLLLIFINFAYLQHQNDEEKSFSDFMENHNFDVQKFDFLFYHSYGPDSVTGGYTHFLPEDIMKEYFKNGYIEQEDARRFVESRYNLSGKYTYSLEILSHPRSVETEKEISDAIESVLDGIRKKEIPYNRLLECHNLIMYAEDHYKNITDMSVERSIIIAAIKSSDYPEKLQMLYEIYRTSQIGYSAKNDSVYSAVQEEYEKVDKQTDVAILKEFLTTANDKYPKYLTSREINSKNFFILMEKNNLYPLLDNLTSKGLYIVLQTNLDWAQQEKVSNNLTPEEISQIKSSLSHIDEKLQEIMLSPTCNSKKKTDIQYYRAKISIALTSLSKRC